MVSLSTKTFMFTKVCKFLKGDKCSIYDNRPKICADWPCGEPINDGCGISKEG